MKTIDALLQHKIMGLVRTNDQATGEAMAEAMVNAGICAIEITLTTPGALNIVEKLSANKVLTVGVGTVLTKKEVKESAKAGAAFIVSPNADTDLVKIRNGDRCFTFKSPNYDGKTRTFNVPFNNQLWRKERTRETITEKEMKEIFIGTFTIEILGDWTRGYEVVGLDNVIIYS